MITTTRAYSPLTVHQTGWQSQHLPDLLRYAADGLDDLTRQLQGWIGYYNVSLEHRVCDVEGYDYEIDRALTDARQALEARAKQHRPWWRVWDRGTV